MATVAELKEQAKEAGIPGYSSMTKAELTEALEGDSTPPQTTDRPTFEGTRAERRTKFLKWRRSQKEA